MAQNNLFELQLIDCNCNNCIFMFRDFDTWTRWFRFHYELELTEFERLKQKAINEALLIEDVSNRAGMLRIANTMKFQFDKSKLIQYGKCSRFGKNVSFIPNVCQLETQHCFMHRQSI